MYTYKTYYVMNSHEFRQKLISKARKHGKLVPIVDEAYTSKTCSGCGWQHPSLGGVKVYRCRQCGLVVGRDVNGARNILLRNTCE